jgi:Holliday junction resolvasome RuvABC endonuclease subunit
MKTIMGIDISSRSTGWCIICGDKLVDFGKINPTGHMTNAQKMYLFQIELRKIIDTKQPDDIAIEDVVQVRSVSVLKLLARFNGIAIIEAYRHTQREPELYEPSRWKSMVDGCTGSAKKCEVQNVVCQKYSLLSPDKFVAYQKRIDVAKCTVGESGSDARCQLKLAKKELKKCKKKEPNDRQKIGGLEQKIKQLQEQFTNDKKSGKKDMSEVFDKISMDIYTETSVNEDIADSIGVAIAHQKTVGERND